MYPYEGFIKYKAYDREIALSFPLNRTLINEYLEIRSKLTDIGSASVFECTINPKIEVQIIRLNVKINESLTNADRVFINGFQTWTESREYEINEKIPKLNRLAWNILSPYGDYTFYPYSNSAGIYHGYTYTYIKRKNADMFFYGSLSEAAGYTVFEHNGKELNIIKDCSGLAIKEEYKAFEIFIASGTEDNVFRDYFNIMNIGKPTVKQCTGWTSWYNYYTGITEEIIIDNLEAFSSRSIPIDIFQIDDGYQDAVGDWLIINEKFPRGMKFIADSIKGRGYKAGLWLAPFICEKRSRLYKEHNSWLLRHENGEPVKAGFNPGWSGTFYVLDFYNRSVRDYLKAVFDTVLEEWGFEMVKLDFLYAAALLPRKYKTRGQIMHEAMKFIREIVEDRIILGCGVPLGPSFGLVDYCRIGSDVALKWEDKLLRSLNYRERVSTINSLRSTIGRRHLNGYPFYNDPDVFILREKNNTLTKEQRNTLCILNLIFGGLVFTSDNIDEYSKEEMKLYLSMFPFRDKRLQGVEFIREICRIEFQIEDRSYIILSNLSDKEAKLNIKPGIYFVRDKGLISGDSNISLKACETVCLLILQNRNFELAGSFNIFPGNEVTEFRVEEDNIVLKLHENCRGALNLLIRIPDGISAFKVNGKPLKAEKVNGLNILKYTVNG